MPLEVSYDASAFEVEAEIDGDRRITRACAQRICQAIDEHGFAVVRNFVSGEEDAAGLEVVNATLADPKRERSSFASQTDIRYGRRDFCPLPCSPSVLRFSALLSRRGARVFTEYCSSGWPVLEISTLTSYPGCSHQYLHRDPSGVLCIFLALEDVSPEQGGTVLAPGTHPYIGSHRGHGGKADLLARLFQLQFNLRLLRYNLRRVTRLWRFGEPKISTQEFRERVFSRTKDAHQPNLLYFLRKGPNAVFNLRSFGLRTLIRLFQFGREAVQSFCLVQATPEKGTCIIYRSDILHAGPDNRSKKPRYFFNINLARDVIHPEAWQNGYSPHSSLRAKPMTLGELIDWSPEFEPSA